MTYYSQPQRWKDFGCYECEWTGSLTVRDERGVTVTYPCDCQLPERTEPQPSRKEE